VRSEIFTLLRVYWLKFGVHFLEEANFGVFGIFLGGKSSTRPITRLFFVNVSKFLQFFFILNGYGSFTLHFFQDYEISSLKS
jgi:hypothetical protein